MSDPLPTTGLIAELGAQIPLVAAPIAGGPSTPSLVIATVAIGGIGFPALHYLTSPLRKAATAAQDPSALNLWAGTGYREATAEPAARILRRLAGQ